jgi:hypothetical protein
MLINVHVATGSSDVRLFNAAYERAVIHAIESRPDLLEREILTCRDAQISHGDRWRELSRTNYGLVGSDALPRKLICQTLAESERAGIPAPTPGSEDRYVDALVRMWRSQRPA